MMRQTMFLLALTGSLCLTAAAASADILFLTGGGRVEGVVTDLGSRWKVQGILGAVLVKKSEVAERMETPYVTEIYEEKLLHTDEDQADEQYRLAMWCRRNGLKKRGDLHLARTLEIDPDHPDARATLGHVNFKGVWLTRGEAVQASMAERGFILYQDRWYTEAGLLAFLDARREERKLQAEFERRRLEREALARLALEEEERLKLLQAERKAVEDALAAAEQTRRERDELLLQNRDLIDLLRSSSFGYGLYGTWGGYVGSYSGGYGIGLRARRYCRAPAYPVPYRSAIGFRYDRGNMSIRGAIR